MEGDQIARAIIRSRAMRVVTVINTETSQEAARRHGAIAGSAIALARSSAAALLLATLTKHEERVTVQIQSDGPLGGVTADATSSGGVRAYLRRTGIPAAGGPNERVSLAHAMGRGGIISVIRDLGMKDLFTGQTSLITGEIDEDVEHYLTASEQIESAVGCDAVLGSDLEVRVSAGILVQLLPGGDSESSAVIRELQHSLRTDGLFQILRDDEEAARDPVRLAQLLLGRHAVELETLDVRPVMFHCRCSRERVSGMLVTLPVGELDALVEEGHAEVNCNFCSMSYEFGRKELEELRDASNAHRPPVS